MKKININRDVRKYKEKLVGPFSTREAFCLVVGFLCFYLIKATFFTDIKMMSDQNGFLLIAVMFHLLKVWFQEIKRKKKKIFI